MYHVGQDTSWLDQKKVRVTSRKKCGNNICCDQTQQRRKGNKWENFKMPKHQPFLHNLSWNCPLFITIYKGQLTWKPKVAPPKPIPMLSCC
jgi:hypothetical protein